MEKIQKAFRNEFVWIGMILTFLWFFVTTVVLPLQKLQIQVTQIQTDLTSQNKKYDALDKLVNNLSTRMSVVETRLDNKKF